MFFLIGGIAFSIDFGLVLGEEIEAENDYFKTDTSFTPWFSWKNDNGISVYVSGILSLRYEMFGGAGEFNFIPEVAYTAFKYQTQNITLEAGRVGYTDAMEFTADGLFDGVKFNMEMPAFALTAGVFYTGLLYKETAKIIMTDDDFISYYDTNYLASSRLLAAVRGDIPLTEQLSLSAEILAQFDLNFKDQALHSQYIEILAEYYIKSMMRLTGGVLAQMMQNNNSDFGGAFGFLVNFKMDLPSSINHWLGFTFKLTTGAVNDIFTSYKPLNSIPQGEVFQQELAGLASFSLDYSIRILPSLYAEAALHYFIRTYDVPGEGNAYGGELWVKAAWQPFEDIRGTLGFGLFIPGMGNVDPSGDVIWKITAGLIMSF
jgi:hypothetical protein